MDKDLHSRLDQLHIPPGTLEERVSTLLDRIDTGHKVIFGASDFTLQHSLQCRLTGKMWNCEIHKRLNAASRPTLLGEYDVTLEKNTLVFERPKGFKVNLE